jgi:Flp pilus assembly protein TadG
MQMLKQLGRILKGFVHERRGNVAILFGFALIPLLLGAGVAVDYGRALLVRERMSDAADAAALAIGSWPDLTPAEMATKAQQFFAANYPPSTLGTVGTLNVSTSDNDITASVSGSVPTTFMRVVNIDHIDLSTSSTITRKLHNIEVVLVLDTTGSMADTLGSSTKISALKSAAKKLVSDLFAGQATSTTVKIGVVPFAAAVNIGTNQLNSGWLDKATYTAANAAADPIPFEDLDKTTGISPLALYGGAKGLTNRSWAGCVRERGGAYALTDDPPSTSTPATLWAPYFAPDEPDPTSGNSNFRYCNTYLSDGGSYNSANCSTTGTTTDDNKRQCYSGKYAGKSAASTSNCGAAGPEFNCPLNAITPMTSTASTVNAAIDALQPKGGTVIPAGLLWGWRVISPTPPFTEGSAYGDDKWVKAIVLLTDGTNAVNGGTNKLDKSIYSAFGYAKNGHLGNINGSDAEATLDSYTSTICNAIKSIPGSNGNPGILLYTIGLGVTSASQTLLTNCATKPSMYYNAPSSDQLASIFSDIAQGLGDLRIAK